MARVKYKFQGRVGNTYYWSRPAPGFGPGYEEQVTCNVGWFWTGRLTRLEWKP